MQPTSPLSRLNDNKTLMLMIGVGAAATYVGYSIAKSAGQNRVAFRPEDDAPARTAKDRPVAGRTITINRPRAELYAFWSDFSNLPQFMQGVSSVTLEGDEARWEMPGPLGRTIMLRTIMTDRQQDERLVWKTTEASDVQMSGHIRFRDAPAERGTEIEAEVAYQPPLGELGRWIGKIFQTDPVIQGRRELRRFKMLMETGEIATNINHKAQS